MSTIDLSVRYYRQYVDPDKPNTEGNFEYVHDSIPLPLEQTALVLVDCWDDHHNDGAAARMEPVLENRIAPVVDAMRETEATILHWPGPHVASNYPEWTHFADEADLGLAEADDPTEEMGWPPAQFSSAIAYPGSNDPDQYGEYAPYTKISEPRASWSVTEAKIHDAVEPDPDDQEFILGTYEQVHRLFAHREILHLLLVGFHTNLCIANRIRELRDRGLWYNLILLRDCTKAMESHDTVEEELHQKIAIRELESGSCYSSVSEDLLTGLER